VARLNLCMFIIFSGFIWEPGQLVREDGMSSNCWGCYLDNAVHGLTGK